MPSDTSTVCSDQLVEELRRELAEAREQQAATAVHSAQQVYPIRFDPEHVASARAILERRTVVIPDATAPDTPEFTRKLQAAGGFRSIAYVPLVNQDKGIGTIILAHPRPGFELTRKQIEVLETSPIKP